MAIDVRASISCSLGDIIQANISDSSISEAGLIKTTGVCELAEVVTPAIGSTVTFTYTTAAGLTRTVPRTLQVLSSFANPYKRTTEVQLGCPLTYRDGLREEIKWTALDDPANSAYTEADQEVITVPISASSVMDYCLEQLGLTATQNPLTNKFSVAEFDYGSGYVQILNDLLVSESYCGFINGDGELEVFSLSQSGGNSPVISVERIIDVGPVNSGSLPGESVVVNYSTLKLKQPDQDAVTNPGNSVATQRWERSETNTGPNSYYLDTREYRGNESTVSITRYKEIKDSDVPDRRVTSEYGLTAKIAGTIGTAYVQRGIGFNAVNTELRREEEVFSYDKEGTLLRREVTQYEHVLSVFGGVSLDYVFSSTNYVTFGSGLIATARSVTTYDTKEDKRQEVASNYVLWAKTVTGQQAVAEARSSLTTSSAVAAYVNFLAVSGLAHQQTSVTINTASGVESRPRIIMNGAYADGGDPANGYRTESSAELELALGSATAQRRVEFRLPYAPDDVFYKSGDTYGAIASDAPQKAALYGRIQNQILLANRNGMSLQCAADALPPRPFMPFVVTAEGISGSYRTNAMSWTMSSEGIIASTDALFWGGAGAAPSASGSAWFPMSPTITTLPAAPAVVDTTPTEVIGTVPTVGATPQTTLNTAFPAAVAGDGVQDTSTDEFWTYDGSTWSNVGTNPGPTMTVTTTVPVWNETVKAEGRVRLFTEVESLGYALAVLTEVPAYGVKVRATATRIKKVLVPAAAVNVAAAEPRVAISATVKPPAAPISVAAVAPAVSISATVVVPAAAVAVAAETPVVVGGASVSVPLADISVTAQAPVSAGPPAALLEVPTTDVAVAAVAPVVATGASVAVPALDVAVASSVPTGLGAYDASFSSVSLLLHMDGTNNSTTFTDSSSNALTVTANGNAKISTTDSKFGGASGIFDGTTDYLTVASSSLFALFAGDFTVEFWLYAAGTVNNQTLVQLSTSGTERANVSLVSNLIVLYTETGGSGATRISATAPAANTWHHIAWTRSGTTSRLFVNGSSVGTATSTPYPSGNMQVSVGANDRTSGGTCLNGYIDDFRITKGVARYSANFTPTTVAFPDR